MCDECEEDEPICDITDTCEAPQGTQYGITNCRHCGKELVKKDGKWWTWDADFFESRLPQEGP